MLLTPLLVSIRESRVIDVTKASCSIVCQLNGRLIVCQLNGRLQFCQRNGPLGTCAASVSETVSLDTWEVAALAEPQFCFVMFFQMIMA